MNSSHSVFFFTGHMPFIKLKLKKKKKRKERKEDYLYSAILVCHTHKELRHGSHSFTCKLHHGCLYFIRVHQMAPPLTEVPRIQLQLTTRSSTPKGWKAELAWLVDL